MCCGAEHLNDKCVCLMPLFPRLLDSVPLPLQVIFHISLELICHIWAGFICYQLSVNCFCLAIISEQERNQSSNEENQTAGSLANLQASSSWIKWAIYVHEQYEESNIQAPVSSKGTLDEEDVSVWIIKSNCHKMRGRNTRYVCVYVLVCLSGLIVLD